MERKAKRGLYKEAQNHICTPKRLGAITLNFHEHTVTKRFSFFIVMFEDQLWLETIAFFLGKEGLSLEK